MDAEDVTSSSLGKAVGKVGSQEAIAVEGNDVYAIYSGKLHRYSLHGNVDDVVATLPDGASEVMLSPRYAAIGIKYKGLAFLDRHDGYKQVARVDLPTDSIEFLNDETVIVGGFGHVSLAKVGGTTKTLFGNPAKSDPIVRIVRRSADGKRVFALVEENVYVLDVTGKQAPRKLFSVGDIGFPHYEGFRIDPETGRFVSCRYDATKGAEVVELRDASGKLLAHQDLGKRIIADFAFDADGILLSQAGPTNDQKSQLLHLDDKTLEPSTLEKFDGRVDWVEPAGSKVLYVYTPYKKQARELYARSF